LKRFDPVDDLRNAVFGFFGVSRELDLLLAVGFGTEGVGSSERKEDQHGKGATQVTNGFHTLLLI
jgi:hypothetical protein